MIIRVAQSMREKLKLGISAVEEQAGHPLCDWTVRLYRCRRTQYILATNTSSLYSVTFYGSGITGAKTFLPRFISTLREHHRAAGMEETYERIIAPST